MLKRLSSAISTAHAISIAIREAPDAIRECVEFARGNAELREELNRANCALAQHNEKRVREVTGEFTLTQQAKRLTEERDMFASDLAKEREITVELGRELDACNAQIAEAREQLEEAQRERAYLQSDVDSLKAALGAECDVALRFSQEADELKFKLATVTSEANELARTIEVERREFQAKLARHEAAERWHQVTGGEGELPPEGVEVIFQYDAALVQFLGYPSNGRTYRWRYASSQDVPQ